MSSVDVENMRKEESKKIPVKRVNETEDHSKLLLDTTDKKGESGNFKDSSASDAHKKKKKIITFSVIGGVVVVAAVVALVLGFTLKAENENHENIIPFPPPPPITPQPVGTPFGFQEVNYYKIDKQVTQQDWTQKTVLQLNPLYSTLESSEGRLKDSTTDGHNYKPVNPKYVPVGFNNKWASQVQLDFGLIDNYQANVNITNLDL